ncbi:GNAT family N-acetyltransferase [Alkalihalobacillus sp. MEB130]|uniref:GNAT family N-acetyltransferase n=1 Tax=Alkalihalobacillus sp. MEB130 TaxID=2976704 RepID=UPI0028DEC1AD|nr:GNAT family N-acetyltransferase [Alkalihalobacillus sp. MEB130]MDT8862692.1 GNAT family N-acetyltransferase [Alkalihalobacillus sp. MEB130]
MDIKLEVLTMDHAEGLLQFEVENREFFEKLVPGRGESYYDRNTFLTFLDELLVEHKKGEGMYYLILTLDGTILGRINLFNVTETPIFSAEIGYRIGEMFLRKGIASKSVNHLKDLLELTYEKIELRAKTTSHNKGSQRILEKNGFVLEAIDVGGASLNGEVHDFLSYTWKNF